MKASELRIGNLVYVTDNLTNLIFEEITPINIHNLMHLTGWDKSPVDIEFKPIPLTEEFLLKFCFEKALNGWWCPDEVISYEGGFVGFGTDRFTMIKYVHELQNYYFAVTGNELSVSV